MAENGRKAQAQALREKHLEVKKGLATLYRQIQDGEFGEVAETAQTLGNSLTEMAEVAESTPVSA